MHLGILSTMVMTSPPIPGQTGPTTSTPFKTSGQDPKSTSGPVGPLGGGPSLGTGEIIGIVFGIVGFFGTVATVYVGWLAWRRRRSAASRDEGRVTRSSSVEMTGEVTNSDNVDEVEMQR